MIFRTDLKLYMNLFIMYLHATLTSQAIRNPGILKASELKFVSHMLGSPHTNMSLCDDF